ISADYVILYEVDGIQTKICDGIVTSNSAILETSPSDVSVCIVMINVKRTDELERQTAHLFSNWIVQIKKYAEVESLRSEIMFFG
ncbi:hypothetical protein, partial [Polynucleobacter sp.]|uniref:hypothetical protein n=1 Tax=Polynucleobacter sp. TaxID=2029855 RepID=UPI003019E4C8